MRPTIMVDSLSMGNKKGRVKSHIQLNCWAMIVQIVQFRSQSLEL